MTNVLLPWPRAKFFSPNTNYPLAGGKVYTYAAGTNTPLATYTSPSSGIANANPVILDAQGEAPIYLTNGAAYKVNLTDAIGNQIAGYPVDNIIGADTTLRADLASSATGLGAALIGFNGHTVADELTALDQHSTGQFYTQNGAHINRMNDRVFIGGATKSDGAFPQVSNDWLSEFYNANGYTGFILGGKLAVETDTSAEDTNAITGATRTLNFHNDFQTAIGVSAIAVHNNPTFNTSAWAFYGEVHRIAGAAAAGNVICAELNTRNTHSAPVVPHPFQQGNVVCMQLASGAGVSGTSPLQFNSSAAMQIVDNPTKWLVGINFMSTGIAGTDGITGTGVAIAMAKGHFQRWYNSAGNLIGGIGAVSSTTRSEIRFGDDGLQILGGPSVAASANFSAVASAVNYFDFSGSATGNGIIMQASGTDANIDIRLIPKGSGKVCFGTNTIGAVAQTGSVTVKDLLGNTYRLLTG